MTIFRWFIDVYRCLQMVDDDLWMIVDDLQMVYRCLQMVDDDLWMIGDALQIAYR